MLTLRYLVVALVVIAGAIGGSPGAEGAKKKKATPIALECGTVIDTSGSYVATKSTPLNCTNDPVVAITASNVTLNLRGRTVDGDGTNTACIEVSGAQTRVAIANGTVRDCSRGISLGAGVTASIVKGNTATGNASTGIRTLGGGNTVKGNTVTGNLFGIVATGGGNTIKGNTVTGNVSNGIDASGGGNTVKGNTATDNNFGVGVSGGGNTVKGNTATGNDFGGIDVSGGGNTVKGNTATGNGTDGIRASGGGNTIVENAASGNIKDGIFVDTPDADTTISENVANDNREDGIDADQAPNVAKGGKNKAANNVGGDCLPNTLC